MGRQQRHRERGHARIEQRTIRVAPADENLFPGAAQAFRLRRDAGGLDGVWESKESSTASPACRPS
jgi:hypothetical protein